MNPNQPTPPQGPQPGYPAQTPPPAPGYSPAPVGPSQQPYVNPYQPQAPQNPQSQQPANSQPSWYIPPTAKADEGPANANDYVNRVRTAPPQDPMNPVGNPVAGGQPQHSIDYLNQLAGSAPGQQAAQPNQKIVLFGIGGFLAVALAVFLLIFTNQGGPTGPKPEQTLYSTIFNSSQVTDKAEKNIRDSQLASISTALNGQLLNDLTAMATPLQKSGIDAKKLQSSLKKKKEFTKTLDKLEDARLNAIYDRVYSREISYELDLIMMQMDKTTKLSTNSKIKEFIKSDKANYDTIKKSLDEYTNKTSDS